MRARHTRRSDATLAGSTIQRSLRLPESLVDQVRDAIERGIPEIHTLTDATTDALWLWLYEAEKQRHPTAQPMPTAVTAPVVASVSLDDGPRSESNGRPSWKDVDPELIEES
jgi:Arc/MetJ-type ribon-helix-helix transcriptional regulator